MKKIFFVLVIIGFLMSITNGFVFAVECSDYDDLGNIKCDSNDYPYGQSYAICRRKSVSFILPYQYYWDWSSGSCDYGYICKNSFCVSDTCISKYGSGTKCISPSYCPDNDEQGHCASCSSSQAICCKTNWNAFDCWNDSDCNSCQKCQMGNGYSNCVADTSKNGSGSCGSSSGGSFCDRPTSNLCDSSYGSTWTDSEGSDGVWGWYCNRKCGGSIDYCTATNLPTVNGTNGYCSSSDGGTFNSAPSSLCSYGSSHWNDSVGSDGIYNWYCSGTSGSCGGSTGSTDYCSATRNFAPTFSSVVIKNSKGVVVPVDSTGKNQICQTSFSDKSVIFEITFSDANGGSDINYDSARLRLGSNVYTPSRLVSRSGNNIVVAFDFNNGASVPAGINTLEVYVADASLNSDWVSTSRQFKFWDCKVSVSGTGYDGSATGSACANDSFTTTVPSEIVYGLTMNDVSSANEDQIMTVNSPAYTSGTNSLTWGRDYLFKLSNFPGTDPTIRLNGAASCTSQITLNASVVDPYQDTMSFTADFTSVLDQDSWWQANDGGVISNNKINNRVPVTCKTDNCKISIGSLVTAPLIDNTGRSETESQSWFYGGVESVNANAKLADVNKNYSYFYKQYLVRNGIGVTAVGNKTIASVNDLGNDPNGIYFIDGNLMINGNIDAGGKFLMVIVNGNITANQNATRVDGILVANNIYAVDNGQLIFNGNLFASNTIDFSGRSFATKSDNNLKPVVKVNYKPELIFKIPGKLAKILANWQWGN